MLKGSLPISEMCYAHSLGLLQRFHHLSTKDLSVDYLWHSSTSHYSGNTKPRALEINLNPCRSRHVSQAGAGLGGEVVNSTLADGMPLWTSLSMNTRPTIRRPIVCNHLFNGSTI